MARVSEAPIPLENAPLEEVEYFTYLGSIIDKKGGTETGLNARIGKARTTYTRMQKMWKA